MTFHHTPLGEYHATGDDYRASVYQGKDWAAVVRVWAGSASYEAYNVRLESAAAAMAWVERALGLLRGVGEGLG